MVRRMFDLVRKIEQWHRHRTMYSFGFYSSNRCILKVPNFDKEG